MKLIILITALTVSFSSYCLSQGYLDYELEIDSQYKLIRTNASEMIVVKTSGGTGFVSSDYNLDKIDKYAITQEIIYLQLTNDKSEKVFFMLEKSNDSLIGPISQQVFSAQTLPIQNNIVWKAPHNPNPILAALTILAFLFVSLYVLCVRIITKYWYLVIIVVILVLYIVMRKHSMKHSL